MHIIFDLYGTLYQPGLNLMSIVKKISDVLDLDYPDEAHVYGMLNYDMDEYLEALYPEVEDRSELKRLFTIYEKEHAHGGDIVPGMKEVLLKLKEQGHYLSICSTGPEAFIDTVLAENNITECFDSTLSARVFLDKGEAIKTVLKPNQDALIVGDTITDFMAAIKNHIPSIGVNHGFGSQDDFSAATFRAKNPDDILVLVKKIEAYSQILKNLTKRKEHDTILFSGRRGPNKSSLIFDLARYLKSLGLKTEIVRSQRATDFQLESKGTNPYFQRAESNLFALASVQLYFAQLSKVLACLTEEGHEAITGKIESDASLIYLIDLD